MIHGLLVICLLFFARGSVHAHSDVYERVDKLTGKFADQPADEVLIRRARLFLELGHPEAAREELLVALEVAPNRRDAYYAWGRRN